jgi:hypothetical protein
VRIKGTKETLFHNGIYEGQCGYLTLESTPANVNASVAVRVGYRRSKIKLKPIYLTPQTTTETPGVVPADAARPIVSCIGERVVIIGPDLSGNLGFVGRYAVVVDRGYRLKPTEASLQMYDTSYPGFVACFDETSLCRSVFEQF